MSLILTSLLHMSSSNVYRTSTPRTMLRSMHLLRIRVVGLWLISSSTRCLEVQRLRGRQWRRRVSCSLCASERS